tara:strand:+ start:2266 stop:2787 length:522 start_codon:yes stop_codon:yes gene_type:complete
MACQLTASILKGCKDGVGGNSIIYIANHELITATTADASGTITGLTVPASGTPFFTFEARKESITTETAIITSDENGTTYYESTIVYPTLKRDENKRLQVNLLAVATVAIIVKDNNGKYWYFGQVNGAELSEGTITSGKAFADKNGYDLTFMAKESVAPMEIDYAAFSTYINA